MFGTSFIGGGIFALAAIALLLAAGPVDGQSPDASRDIDQVRQNFAKSLLPTQQSDIRQLDRLALRDAQALRSDGTWADVDYSDTARSAWKTHEHLARTLRMAQSARIRRDGGQIDLQLEAKTLAALQAWTDRDFQNSNWWWNQIGVPQGLGQIAVLLDQRLGDAQRQKIVQIMRRSQWQKWTGANLVWGATIQAVRGVLENDPQTISQAFDRMYKEIRVVRPNEEGIQADGSFHQHGAQLYNGGYGLDFSVDAGQFISFAAGTRFAIPADRMAVFTNFLLDGQQWMIRGDVFDFSAAGREITRKGKLAVPNHGQSAAGASEQNLAGVVALVAAQPSARQEELRRFAARLAGAADAPELVGNKQFWCSDYMAHRRPGFFASVKMLSTRMQNGEIVNGEGKTSQHLSDGANLLYLGGNEYEDIFPCWDWTHIPGTTALADVLERGDAKSVTMRGGSDFVGGVSDGAYGLCAMELARPPLLAHKAWFFFDDAYLCLGAGITLAQDADNAVVTDVNQTHLAGDVVTDSGKFSQTGAVSQDAMSWVYHNHVGYVLAPRTPARLWAGPRTGRWSDIGTGSDQPVTQGVFDLWIDHGRRCRDAQYQFIVLPGASAAQTAQRAKDPGIDVLINTPDVQAVYEPSLKLLGIVFSKPGALDTPIGRVQVDIACLLMVRDTDKGRKVTAANPRNVAAGINVNIGNQRVSIDLPGGNDAGRSVTVDIPS